MESRLTLFELNHLVRELIEYEMEEGYWVEAELSECRESRGHCYMELIQKDEHTSTPIAKASAKCWATKWQVVRPYFERTTGQQLCAGMKVLLNVYPQFHEAFGFSWIVTDIDPTYTLGDMAHKRQEIIRQLKEEGVLDLQKELHLPLFCQRIAVISSETAAGYGDFFDQLQGNPYGFLFTTQLFPSIMQGESTEQSIIASLDKINALEELFDCVVIIRGGGATSDMSGFDTLALAENVANFPLPVITGIGHERDECILDMVSHQRVKTPTAAAALLIDHLKQVLDILNNAQESIIRQAQQKMAVQQNKLATLQSIIPSLFSVVKTQQEARIDTLYNHISSLVQQKMATEKHNLQLLEEKVKSLDPEILLKRGYSITLYQGKAVRDPGTLSKGEEIETRVEKGIIKSIIK